VLNRIGLFYEFFARFAVALIGKAIARKKLAEEARLANAKADLAKISA